MRQRPFHLLRHAAAFAGMLFATALFPHIVRAEADAVATPTPSEEGSPAPAGAATDKAEAAKAKMAEIVKSLRYTQGNVALKDGLAKLAIPQDFRFLGPEDSEKVLHNLWGNPPRQNVLGMILPSDVGPDSPESWAVVITYEEAGYIKDNDADSIDYGKLMTEMKQAVQEANKERVAEGYDRMELVGWAAPPRYDKAAKKMYWAKELKFEGSDRSTLNYNIRILGRRGVLVLNAVAGMSQLPEIEKAAPTFLSMVDFNEGHRYADFNPKTDKVAAYGLAALVAGGVAAKMGLFKVAIGALIAAKKFVVIGVVAVVAWVKRLLGSGRERRS